MQARTYEGPTQILVIGLKPGDLLLESIRAAIKAHGVTNGAVISGIGTLKTCQMHYIIHSDFPVEDKKFTLTKPLELLSVSGLIADGEPHLHITLSCGENEVYGGHLEEDCEVLYLAEIGILVFNELKMVREMDDTVKVKLLNFANALDW